MLAFIFEEFKPESILQGIPLLLAILFLTSSAPRVIDSIKQLHEGGGGYTSLAWRESDVIQAVRKLPKDISLISNDSSAILFLTGQPAYTIPEIQSKTRVNTFQTFGNDANDEVQSIFLKKDAALILFDNAYGQFFQIYGNDTNERLQTLTNGLYLYYQGTDGAIYFYHP
jgi:hypothetical protein